MPTHFISKSKSYLHCGTQHQSWRAATTRLNMFSGLQISFLQLNYINSNVSHFEYPEFSSVVECAFSGVLPRVRIAKRSLFAGLAFARVTILNIRKSNGFSCPGWSSESQRQAAGLPYSVQEWNARGGPSTSVLLLNSRRFTRP